MKRFGHDHDGGRWTQGRIEADVAGPREMVMRRYASVRSLPTSFRRHGFVEERRPSVPGNWDCQADRFRRPAKPGNMLVPHEDPAPVRANRFIHAIAVEKTMIEDGDDGLLVFHELIIEINPRHYYVCCSALKKAWAFWIVSSYSLAGSESATIPAPTCKYPFPPHHTKVRITILRSRSPFQPMYPNDPV